MDNDNPHSATQHSSLAALLDPFTTERIAGLRDLAGANCLEVGAGAGSVAHWLAERVGPTGSVTATDVKPHQIPPHPQLTVVRHDLVTEPVPGGPYDLIHARLVLAHLPQRREILGRLARALAVGGVLVVEDWDASRTDTVLAAPTMEAARLYNHHQEVIGNGVFAAHGTDRTWARRIHAAMLEEGLSEVDTIVHARSWTGGGPGCRLVASNLEHLRDKVIAAGFSAEQIAELRPILDDPRLVIAGHLLYSTSGWRTG